MRAALPVLGASKETPNGVGVIKVRLSRWWGVCAPASLWHRRKSSLISANTRSRVNDVPYRRDPPRAYLAAGTDFLGGTLTPAAPAGARAAQVIARTLRTAIDVDGRGMRSVAAAGTTHTTIGRIMNGRVYADVDTLASLQQTLEVHLWPPPDNDQQSYNHPTRAH